MTQPVIVVAGAGPGVSGAVARRYAAAGFDVGLLGVERGHLDDLAKDLSATSSVLSEVVDITNASAARAEIEAMGRWWSRIDVVHFSPSAFREKTPMDLTVDELLDDVALGVGALLTVVQAARPFMTAGGRITVTGSMAADNPWNRAASLGVQKAGVRNLVHSLDATLAPDGIRAVSVTVHGVLAHDGLFTSDRVAEAIWNAARQDEAGWLSEVAYSG
ncbi:SDR family oxidoreductase [Gordonia terrae]|uniref:SDR family oxidoreductase n=1 Tax=Gordonia terrae TaxID=2055 RepID=UPI00200B23A0|nr:SDR family oxidoreductase [Gordonia terrae]UPW08590.1 SDR family oxidoreductase [Gordonia terrae]